MSTISNIYQFIDYKDITVSEFSKKIAVSNGYFAKQRASEGAISSQIIEKIVSQYPEINLEWLITGNGNMIKEKGKGSSVEGIPLIPIEAVAGYGKGELVILEDDVQDRYVIPEFSRKGVKYIIRVSGSSMYPKYSNGDLLGCKPIEDTSFFQWGKPYVLDTDQGPIVKRLFPVEGEEDTFECRSDNGEHYPPFKIRRSSIYRIAIVVGVIRQE